MKSIILCVVLLLIIVCIFMVYMVDFSHINGQFTLARQLYDKSLTVKNDTLFVINGKPVYRVDEQDDEDLFDEQGQLIVRDVNNRTPLEDNVYKTIRDLMPLSSTIQEKVVFGDYILCDYLIERYKLIVVLNPKYKEEQYSVFCNMIGYKLVYIDTKYVSNINDAREYIVPILQREKKNRQNV